VLEDRGYIAREEILACVRTGVIPLVPKPLTSPAKAEGRFGKQDFTPMSRTMTPTAAPQARS
jgi:transposase